MLLLLIFSALFVRVSSDRSEATQDVLIVYVNNNNINDFSDIDPGIWVGDQDGSTP